MSCDLAAERPTGQITQGAFVECEVYRPPNVEVVEWRSGDVQHKEADAVVWRDEESVPKLWVSGVAAELIIRRDRGKVDCEVTRSPVDLVRRPGGIHAEHDLDPVRVRGSKRICGTVPGRIANEHDPALA